MNAQAHFEAVSRVTSDHEARLARLEAETKALGEAIVALGERMARLAELQVQLARSTNQRFGLVLGDKEDEA